MSKYGFFYDNTLYALAESDDEKNWLSTYIVGAVTKSISDLHFNNAKNYKSNLILNNDIVEENSFGFPPVNNSETNFDEAKIIIKDLIERVYLFKINSWLRANKESSHYSYWNDYKTKLQAVDVDSITFPLTHETFIEWFTNQPNNPSKSPLQLP
jgi:hypothetical protein